MKGKFLALGLALAALAAGPASAAEKLVVSTWGGSFRDLIADTIAKKSPPKPAWRWNTSPAAPSTG